MSFTLTTGSTISIAQAYEPALGSAAVATTAASNASSCVLTCDNDGTPGPAFADGDYVVVTSGWDLLDSRVVRVASATTTTVTLEGVDTSDTAKYPTGSGVGTIRRVAASGGWSQITQVKSISSSGGTQNYADITTITNTTEKKIPTTRAAVDMTIDVFDDPTQSWYADVQAADDARTPYAVKMTFPNGAVMCGNAYWSLARVPGMAQNEALTTQINLSFAADPIRYSAST